MARGKDNRRIFRRDRSLATESTADIGRNHAHARLRPAKKRREIVARTIRGLSGQPNRHAIRVGPGKHRPRLQRHGRKFRSGNGKADRPFGHGQDALLPAGGKRTSRSGRLVVDFEHNGIRCIIGERLFGCHNERHPLPGDDMPRAEGLELRKGVQRQQPIDRRRPRRRKIIGGKDRNNPRHLPRGVRRHLPQGARTRRAYKGGEKPTRHTMIVGKGAGTGHQPRILAPHHRRAQRDRGSLTKEAAMELQGRPHTSCLINACIVVRAIIMTRQGDNID